MIRNSTFILSALCVIVADPFIFELACLCSSFRPRYSVELANPLLAQALAFFFSYEDLGSINQASESQLSAIGESVDRTGIRRWNLLMHQFQRQDLPPFSALQASESKKEAFRKHLEASGVLDA